MATVGKLSAVVDVEVRTRIKRPSPWERHPRLANALDLGLIASLVVASWIVVVVFAVGLVDVVKWALS